MTDPIPPRVSEDGAVSASWLATLFPGYFALVMATGIIAIGAEQQDLAMVADVLFAIAAVAFAVLTVLYLVRLFRYTQRFVDDLTNHATAFAFLTAVASANVVGSGAALIHGAWAVAWVCWATGLVTWVVLVYAALLGVMLRQPKAELGHGINGTWFLLTVATESVAVLGALLLKHYGAHQVLELVSLSAFTLGIVLYLVVMTLIFFRWTFFPIDPEEMQPPSWIAAGAVAITVLAGSNLLATESISSSLTTLAPFLEGMVILAWATATFWIPVMVAIGVWRHLIKDVPLAYHPSLWAMVFPIGMYGAATDRMSAVTGFDELAGVAEVVTAIALGVWLLVFVGMLASFVPRRRPPAPQ